MATENKNEINKIKLKDNISIIKVNLKDLREEIDRKQDEMMKRVDEFAPRKEIRRRDDEIDELKMELDKSDSDLRIEEEKLVNLCYEEVCGSEGSGRKDVEMISVGENSEMECERESKKRKRKVSNGKEDKTRRKEEEEVAGRDLEDSLCMEEIEDLDAKYLGELVIDWVEQEGMLKEDSKRMRAVRKVMSVIVRRVKESREEREIRMERELEESKRETTYLRESLQKLEQVVGSLQASLQKEEAARGYLMSSMKECRCGKATVGEDGTVGRKDATILTGSDETGRQVDPGEVEPVVEPEKEKEGKTSPGQERAEEGKEDGKKKERIGKQGKEVGTVVREDSNKAQERRRTGQVKEVRKDISEEITVQQQQQTQVGPGPRMDSSVVMVKVMEEGMSNGEMLKEARSRINLEELGIGKTRVRMARNGGVIIDVMGDDSRRKARLLKGRFEEEFGGRIRADNPTRTSSARLVGLDPSIGEEEIAERIGAEGGCTKEELKVVRISPMRNGLKMTWVWDPKVVIDKLTKRKTIRIGWTEVRIGRDVDKPIQCFRCWRFGHSVEGCEGKDRRGNCFGCGKEGHSVRGCVEDVRCAVCEEDGREARHRIGTERCWAWKDVGRGNEGR